VDTELELPEGRQEISRMKKSNPSNKPPLFRILGELTNNPNGGADGNE